MSARKKRPVLYELVSPSPRPPSGSGRTAASPPAGGAGRPPTTPATGGPPRTAPKTDAAAARGSAAPRSAAGPHDSQSAPPYTAWLTSLLERVKRMHLGWPQLAIAGAAVMVLAIVIYAVAQRGATPAKNDSGAQLVDVFEAKTDKAEANVPRAAPKPSPAPLPTHRPSGTTVNTPVQPGGDASATAPPTKPDAKSDAKPDAKPGAEDDQPAEAFQFESDRYYVVVQFFPRRGREAAEAARGFLQSRGVDCVVYQGPQKDWWLLAREPFADAAAAGKLSQRIRQLGKDYAATGAGYDFRDCQARKF